MGERSQQLRPPARGSINGGWHGLGRRHAARPLALNVPDDQPADVRSARAALVLGLDVEVGDVLDGELDRYAALAFSSGPTGHGVEWCGSGTIGVGMRNQNGKSCGIGNEGSNI